MPRRDDWFRQLYAVVRALFVLLDGEYHKPHPLRKELRKGDEAALRGLRQKELELLLIRTSRASPGCIEAKFHAKGWEFRLISVPDLADLTAPTDVPRAVREDARFEAMLDSFNAAARVVNEGGDPEAALRAFNGQFPHETKALRRLAKALEDLLLNMLERAQTDPAFADEITAATREIPRIEVVPGAAAGIRAHAILTAAVENRTALSPAVARVEAALA